MERIWRVVATAPRAALEQQLSPTDRQSLLLGVARTRAGRVTPARVVRRWREDRVGRPARQDPRVVVRVEARLGEMLPESFVGVELSSVAPLGTCSAVTTVDQNRVVSTVRGSEVLADPTTAVAVEAAWCRAEGARGDRVDVAAWHRVLRAQAFDASGLAAHFTLCALVSSARDAGSGATEAQMLADHVRYWSRVRAEFVPPRRPRLVFTVFDSPPLADRFTDVIAPAVAAEASEADLVADPGRTQGADSYTRAAIGLRAQQGDEDIDLGDGGTTTWTASLLGDAQERCVLSGVATERLAMLSC